MYTPEQQAALNRMREYLKSATPEQLQSDLEQITAWNQVGPTLDEYIKGIPNTKNMKIKDPETKETMKSYIQIQFTIEKLENAIFTAKQNGKRYVKFDIPTQLPVHQEKEHNPLNDWLRIKEHTIRLTPKVIMDEYGKGGSTFSILSDQNIPTYTVLYKKHKDSTHTSLTLYIQSATPIGDNYFEYEAVLYTTDPNKTIKLEEFKYNFFYYE